MNRRRMRLSAIGTDGQRNPSLFQISALPAALEPDVSPEKVTFKNIGRLIHLLI
jgi:hypothetical protein